MKKKDGTESKLGTYAVIMLLTAIIIIIIAALADNRESKFQSELEATTQANMTIQNEIVSLKDENYKLKIENEELNKKVDELSKELTIYGQLNECLSLDREGKSDEAKTKFSELDFNSIPENCKNLYLEVKDELF